MDTSLEASLSAIVDRALTRRLEGIEDRTAQRTAELLRQPVEDRYLNSLQAARYLGLQSPTDSGLKKAARAWFNRPEYPDRKPLVESADGVWRVERARLDVYLKSKDKPRTRPMPKAKVQP